MSFAAWYRCPWPNRWFLECPPDGGAEANRIEGAGGMLGGLARFPEKLPAAPTHGGEVSIPKRSFQCLEIPGIL